MSDRRRSRSPLQRSEHRRSAGAQTSNTRVETEPQSSDVVRMNAFRFNMNMAPQMIHCYELVFVLYRKMPIEKAPDNYKPRTNARVHSIDDLGLGYCDDENGDIWCAMDMSIGPMDSVRKQKRKSLTFQLFRYLLGTEEFKKCFPGSNHRYAYDAIRMLYSPEVLNLKDGEFYEKIYIENLPQSIMDLMDFTTTVEGECVMVYIKQCSTTFDLHDFGTETDPLIGVEHFLDTLTWQHAFDEAEKHIVYDSKSFVIDSVKQLKHVNGFRSIVGFEKRVELIPDPDPKLAKIFRPLIPVMRMTPKFELFYDIDRPKIIADYIAIFLDCNNTEDLDRRLEQLRRENRNDELDELLIKASRVLKGAIVRTKHRNDGRQDVFIVDHVDRRNAHQIELECEGDGGDKMTVAEYLYDHYDFVVDSDDTLPCIARKFNGEFAYYPMRALHLLPNQKVVSQYLPEDIKEWFKDACQNLPANAVDNITRALNDLNLTVAPDEYQSTSDIIGYTNPYLESFNITIQSNELVAIGCTRMEAPYVAYKCNKDIVRTVDGIWSYQKLKMFVEPINPIVSKPFRLGIVNTCSSRDISLDEIGCFTRKIGGWLKTQHGMKINLNRESIVSFTDFAQYFGEGKSVSQMLERAVETIELYKLRHVIVICSGGKADKTYDVWKLAEMTNAISRSSEGENRNIFVTTQCLTPKTIKAVVVQSPYGDRILTSIIMKLNLKLGGTNYVLRKNDTPDEPVNKMTSPHINPSRMFIGVDVRNPSKVQNCHGPHRNPTVVGFCYSTSNPNFMLRGAYWYQYADDINMEELGRQLKDALDDFRKNLPKTVFMYWKSNKISQDFTKEKATLSTILSKYYEERKASYKPKFVLISVETKPNIRLFPDRIQLSGHTSNQNVGAGTLIKETFATDNFTLVSHNSQAGLAQPVRFTVHTGMPEELNIEELTNTLCYLQNTSWKTTSVPAPLYSAIDLSNRGLSNYETMVTVLEEEGKNMSDIKSPDKLQDHYTSVLRMMAVKHAGCKYWA
uniref:Piwi domain-containing protein n=1 Tax=Steinernema glaseri TaxID=37863 RepID=A0A1I7ZDP0_9BILA